MKERLGTVVVSVLLLLGVTGGSHDRMRAWAEDKPAEEHPKILLRTQDGKVVDFYDLVKDKTVIINFMFTECKGSCPQATRNLVQVQNLLGKRLGTDVYMYSITVKPTHDIPQVLKKYAEVHKARPGWTFLTSLADRPGDIAALQRSLGSLDPIREVSAARALGRPADSDDVDGPAHSGVIEIRNFARNLKAMAPVTAAPSDMLEAVERIK